MVTWDAVECRFELKDQGGYFLAPGQTAGQVLGPGWRPRDRDAHKDKR